jgi:hypothetical protein
MTQMRGLVVVRMTSSGPSPTAVYRQLMGLVSLNPCTDIE